MAINPQPVSPPDTSAIRDAYQAVTAQLSRRIIGQKQVVRELIVSFFAGGHVLLVGVPGLAKTLLVRSFADVLGLGFNRIQFTPDLMPSDVTGTDVIASDSSTSQRGFSFLSGPIFNNIILADEINRTPPKTQSSLLEAMEEYQVTVAGQRYELPQPFFVMATQNPIEQEGTYPLPLAALDRFLFNILVDYPLQEEELEMLFATTSRTEETVERVLERGEVLEMLARVRRVGIAEETLLYATRLVRESRPKQSTLPYVKEMVEVGGSPRAVQALIMGGKSNAALDGRVEVLPSDIRAVAYPALRHRIVPSFHATADGITSGDIVTQILKSVPRPSNDVADTQARKAGFSPLRWLLGAPKPRKRKVTALSARK